MFGQSLIVFREALEAALLISIILAYLTRSGKEQFRSSVWYGVGGALALSLVIGIGIWQFYGGLSDASMKLFEAIASFIAVIVLTSMVIWMAKKAGSIRDDVGTRIGSAVRRESRLGVAAVAFILVFREGFETILFLIPFATDDPGGTLLGTGMGLIAALAISFAIFRIGIRLDLRRFFSATSIMLILLAGGLAGYGVHELIEYWESVGHDPGWLGSYAFNLGISEDNPFHHKGGIGSVFAVLFGYSVKMEWARIIVHGVYLATVLPMTLRIYRRDEPVKDRTTSPHPLPVHGKDNKC